jgi:hypothetical protein
MLTEIIELVEIARKLVSRKAELDKSYFEDFIQPAWEAFVKIHSDYMKSLREYADLVSQKDIPIEILTKKISQDSIYTRDLRTELHTLLEHMPSARLRVKEKHLRDFELSLINYFDDRSKFDAGRNSSDQAEEIDLAYDDTPAFIDTPYGLMQGIPVARMPLIVFLARKGEASNRQKAKDLFNRVALNLQDKYKEAADAYHQLRKTLLT